MRTTLLVSLVAAVSAGCLLTIDPDSVTRPETCAPVGCAGQVCGFVDCGTLCQPGSGCTQRCNPCRTFVTTGSWVGDIVTAGGQAHGPASADALCMADPNKPAGGTYKAMLVDGVHRVACTTANCGSGAGEHVDWVLAPGTTYTRRDGTTVVMTTGATGIWDFVDPTTDPHNLPATFDTTGSTYWTGLEWQWVLSSALCGSWSDGGATVTGDYGFGDRPDDSAIGGGANYCNLPRQLLCIEQ
jgi:hypothetical protein